MKYKNRQFTLLFFTALVTTLPHSSCEALASPTKNRYPIAELSSLCKARPPYFANTNLPPKEAVQFYIKELGKQNPSFFVKITDAGKVLLETSTASQEYQRRLEAFTFTLNASRAKQYKNNVAWDLWNEFSSPANRSKNGLKDKTTCIIEDSIAFQQFRQKFLKTYSSYFSSSKFFQPQLDFLNKNLNSIFPSGHRAFFGATVSVSNGKNRLCINPEESPLLLLAKVSHETVHAINNEILKMKLVFYKKREKLVEARNNLEAKYDALINFEDYLTPDSALDIDTVIDAIPPKMPDAKAKKFIQGYVSNATQEAKKVKSPFKGISDERGVKAYSELLHGWYTELGRKVQYQGELFKFKARLDRLRFLDENRAYGHSLISAIHLLKNHPRDFCEILVPSFQAKKPVLFYEAYLDLQQHIQSGTLGKFIAESYISQGAYLETAILNEDKEIKQSLQLEARKILDELFASYGLAASSR